MHRNTKFAIGIAGGAAAVMASAIIGFAAGTALVASATDTVPVVATGASSAPEPGFAGHRPGPNESTLTGSDAQKATAAAQEAVEGGTIIRIETDSEGTYEAHVRKTDGTEVVVKMDKDFNVTGVEPFSGRRGGPNETPLTGSDAQKATAAAQEAVEGGTIIRVETDSEGTYEAHVRKTDGTEVVVKMDKDFNVTGVESFSGGRGGRHGHGPHHADTAVPVPSSAAA